MLLTGISYNAGVVKYFFPTLLRPLRDERHFALVEISAIPTGTGKSHLAQASFRVAVRLARHSATTKQESGFPFSLTALPDEGQYDFSLTYSCAKRPLGIKGEL